MIKFTIDENLRPCPFCKSRAVIKDEYGFYTIECTHKPDCLIRGTIMPLYPSNAIYRLVSDWNGTEDGRLRYNKEDDLR